MKIAMISDTHMYHKDVKMPKADILIHAGDFTMLGNPLEAFHFNEWLGTLDYEYKIVIAGNHDKCVGEDPMFGMKNLTNCIYLQNSGITIEGLKFWGSPMTPAFNGMRGGLTFFTNGDREAKGIWAGIPKNLDFLITHGPPHGILDEVRREFNGYYMKENVGDKMLLDKVLQRKPKHHVFGHIHEGYGQMIKNGIKFINASVLNEAYNCRNKPIVIDI